MTHPLDKIQEIRRRYLLMLGLISSQCDPQQMHRDIGTLLAEVERLREALQSIAGNTCCDSCQEAARVARKALENNRLAAHADTLAALDAAAAKTDKEGAP